MRFVRALNALFKLPANAGQLFDHLSLPKTLSVDSPQATNQNMIAE
jgi:hypothetical protein